MMTSTVAIFKYGDAPKKLSVRLYRVPHRQTVCSPLSRASQTNCLFAFIPCLTDKLSVRLYRVPHRQTVRLYRVPHRQTVRLYRVPHRQTPGQKSLWQPQCDSHSHAEHRLTMYVSTIHDLSSANVFVISLPITLWAPELFFLC